MINLWVKCLCLLVSVISSTKHKYLLPCYAPKGCRSQKEAESSEKVSIFHSHLCIMYVWCAAVRPRCIRHLSPNCLAEVLVWDAVTAVCPCEPLIPTIHAGERSAVSTIPIPVSVSALYMMKQMDVVAAHRVEQVPNWLQTSQDRWVRRIRPGLSKVLTTTKPSVGRPTSQEELSTLGICAAPTLQPPKQKTCKWNARIKPRQRSTGFS